MDPRIRKLKAAGLRQDKVFPSLDEAERRRHENKDAQRPHLHLAQKFKFIAYTYNTNRSSCFYQCYSLSLSLFERINR